MFLQYINIIIVVLVVQIKNCSSLVKFKHNVFSIRASVQTTDTIHVETYDGPNKPNKSHIIPEYNELQIESNAVPATVDIDDNIMEAYDDDVNINFIPDHEHVEFSIGENEHVISDDAKKVNYDDIPSDQFPSIYTPLDGFDMVDPNVIPEHNREFSIKSDDEIKLRNLNNAIVSLMEQVKLSNNYSHEINSIVFNLTEQITLMQFGINKTSELVDVSIKIAEMNIDETRLLKQEISVCNADIQKLKSMTFGMIKKNRVTEGKILNNTLEIQDLKSQISEINEVKTTVNNMQEEFFEMKYKLAYLNQTTSSNNALNNSTATADFVRHHSSLKMALTLFMLTLTSVLQPEIRSGVRFIINRIKSI